MPKAGNKTFYHYVIITVDNHGKELKKRYYLTLFEIMDEYKVSRATLSNLLNGKVKKCRKIKDNIEIKRIKEPVRISVLNPSFICPIIFTSHSNENT